MTTTVRSTLARTEQHDAASDRCVSQYRVGRADAPFAGQPVGTVVTCTRPNSRHKVHEHRAMQWDRSNVK